MAFMSQLKFDITPLIRPYYFDPLVTVLTGFDCSDVTTFAESAVYILHIFANNFGTNRDSLLQ